MKKQLLFLFGLMLATTFSWAINVSTITVGTGGDYTVLQDAVTNAPDGSEIEIITAGTYAGIVMNASKSLSITNGSAGIVTIPGASPALTVSSGSIAFDGITFTTTSDDPTILVTGGSLELRNCVIIESTGFNQSGILVSGGSVDAGTALDPGHNTFTADFGGMAISNTSGTVTAISNFWGTVHYMSIAAIISGAVDFDPWCNSTFTTCDYSVTGGPVTFAPKAVATPGSITVPVVVNDFENVDAISLTLDFDPNVLQYDGLGTPTMAIPGINVSFNNTTGRVIIGWWSATPVASLPDGTVLIDLPFVYSGGTTLLSWYDNIGTESEYQNASIQYPYLDQPQADYYKDGWITDIAYSGIAATNVICKGTQSGTIEFLSPTGGITPPAVTSNHEFSIDGINWQSSPVFNVYAGVYPVSMRDGNYPDVVIPLTPASVTILEPTLPLGGAAAGTKRVRCKGESNGEATVTPSGGWGGYTYVWSDPANQTTAVATGLAAGTYTVTITDVGGCQVVRTAHVIEPTTAFTASVVESKVVTCKGDSDGEFTITAQHGWGYYMYSIDMVNYYNYLTSNSLGGLSAGTYNIRIIDDEECEIFLSVDITEPAVALGVTATVQDASCYGYNDGEITANAVGGWGSYEYSIDGGANWQLSPVFSNLYAGTYTVMLRDLHGCVVSVVADVLEPALLEGEISGTTDICFGHSTLLSFDLTGGTAPYNLTYTDGVNNYNVPNITVNPFTVSVSPAATTTYTIVSLTDAHGCIGVLSGSAVITVNPLPEVGFSFNNNLAGTGTIFEYCYNENVEVTLSDIWVGLAPFDISWSVDNGSTVTTGSVTSANLNTVLFSSLLTPGSYVVQITNITDANGCSPTDYTPYTATAVVHPEPAVGFSFNGVLAGTSSHFEYCYDEAVTVDLSHIWVGTAPFNLEWTVDDGSVTTTYNATGVSLSDILFNNTYAPGNYTIQITSVVDDNGCSPSDYTPYMATMTVFEEPMISFGFNGVEAGHNASFQYCYDEPVEVTLFDIYGGDAPYSVTYEVNGVTSTVTGLYTGSVISAAQLYTPGIYNVVVTDITDVHGCKASAGFLSLATATITVHDEPMFSFGFNGVEAGHNASFEYCYNEAVEVTLFDVYGGTAPYSVTYEVNGVTSTVTGLTVGSVIAASQIYAPGIYNIVVTDITDVYGCKASTGFLSLATATITIHDEPMFSFGFNGVEAGHNASFQYCYNETVEVTLFDVYGGDAPYTVTYEVNGVTSTVNGLYTGSIISAAQVYLPGVYNIVVTDITDVHGCHASAGFLSLATATVTIHDEPMFSFGFNGVEAGHNATFEYCYNEPVEVTLFDVYGGTAPYSVTYEVNGGTPVTVTGLSVGSVISPSQLYTAGVYNIVVTDITDANGCHASASFLNLATATVTINPEPAIGFSFNGILTGTYSVFDFCYSETVTVDLSDIWAGTAPFDIVYSVDDGSGPVTTSLTGVSLNDVLFASTLPVGTHVVNIISIVDANGCSPSDYTPYSATVVIHSYDVSGYFNYHNASETPMNNVSVTLQQGSVTYGPVLTNSTGYYMITGVCPGSYEVIATTVKPVNGAINSTDAVQVNSWGVAAYSIEKTRYLAGDATTDNNIDGGDAFFILGHFLSGGNNAFSSPWQFWAANDYINSNPFTDGTYPVVTVGFADLSQDFYGLATGDFNRSFTPGAAKSSGSVSVMNGVRIPAISNEVAMVPVSAEMNLSVTAASLIFHYPADKVEIVEVTLEGTSISVPFSASNGILRIGYQNIVPLMLNAGDVLFQMAVRPTSALAAGETVSFVLASDPLNELADAAFEVIPNALLSVGSIEGTVGMDHPETGALSLNVYPNPFSGQTSFIYTLPAEGKVSMDVYDLLGRKAASIEGVSSSAGSHKVEFDASGLAPGVYMASLRYQTESGVQSRTIKIIHN